MKNIKNKKLSKKLITIISIVLVVIILVTTITICLTKKEKNVEIESTGRIQKQAMNPNNYTMVKSKDGIDVPVPKGYTASSVENESYVNGKVEDRYMYWYELDMLDTLADFPVLEDSYYMFIDNRYEFEKNSEGIWVSGNAGVGDSVSEAITDVFAVNELGGKVTVSFAVSSESNDYIWGSLLDQGGTPISDEFEIMVSGTECGIAENELKYIEKEIEITNAGNYMLAIGYLKDTSGDDGLDTAYIKEIKVRTQNINDLLYPVVNEESEKIGVVQTINGGFVIYEGDEKVTEQNKYKAQATRNQYVWVPIADVKDMYWIDEETDKLYGTAYVGDTKGYRHRENRKNEPQLVKDDIKSGKLTDYMGGISRFEYLQEMEQDFYEMLQSVATYGGFYIGRYEAGNVGVDVDEEGNYFPEEELVVKRFNKNRDAYFTKNLMSTYKRSKEMSVNNSHVETHIIWGTQYDQVLKWIIDTGARSNAEVWNDSSDWGYYAEAGDVIIYTYDDSTGGVKVTVETVDKDNPQYALPTGSCEEWKANNIYDLAGNVAELTMEAGASDYYYRYYRFFRGGRVEKNFLRIYPEDTEGRFPFSGSYGGVGARTTLYIK